MHKISIQIRLIQAQAKHVEALLLLKPHEYFMKIFCIKNRLVFQDPIIPLAPSGGDYGSYFTLVCPLLSGGWECYYGHLFRV